MKKLVLASVFFAFSLIVKAQDWDENGWTAKFGAAGGFQGAFFKPDLKPLSNFLKEFGTSKLADNGIVGMGGGGYAYLMIIQNVRIGGIGYGASASESAIIGGANREAEYSYGFGGVTLEYTLPFVQHFGVSFGAIIGGGTAVLKFYQNSGSVDWTVFSHELTTSGDAKIFSHSFKSSFFAFVPTLNVDIPLNRFTSLRMGAGYVLTFGDEWKMDNDVSVMNMPSALKSDTFFLNLGLYFGFFVY